MIAVINNEGDFAKYKGALKGKMLLLGTGRELPMSLQPLAVRRSDADLAATRAAPVVRLAASGRQARRPPAPAAQTRLVEARISSFSAP